MAFQKLVFTNGNIEIMYSSMDDGSYLHRQFNDLAVLNDITDLENNVKIMKFELKVFFG